MCVPERDCLSLSLSLSLCVCVCMCVCVCRQISDKEAASSRYLEKKRQAVVEVQSLQDSIGRSMDMSAPCVFHFGPVATRGCC